MPNRHPLRARAIVDKRSTAAELNFAAGTIALMLLISALVVLL